MNCILFFGIWVEEGTIGFFYQFKIERKGWMKKRASGRLVNWLVYAFLDRCW